MEAIFNALTLGNFDKAINQTILKRGYSYYVDGAVSDIEENNGSWTAEVTGTDIYAVMITLEDDQAIRDYFCDCPYDGDLCKHVAAVLYSMRDEFKERETKPKSKASKKNRFEDLLSKINAEEFKSFIKHYSAKNKDFKTDFEIFFADKDDSINIVGKYGSIVKKLVKQFSAQGYVDYRSSSGLSREIGRLIGDAYNLIKKNNYADAFSVACVLLNEMMEVITYCDDSNGSIGGTLSGITELIGEIAHSAVTDMQETVFSFLQSELKNNAYFGYGDFGYELFYTYKSLAIELGRKKEFLAFIDARVSALTGKYDDYSRDFFNTEKIDFLQKTGDTNEVERLIWQNLDIVSVRQAEVDKLIAKKDFESAKIMIAGGIEIALKNQEPGNVTRWEKELLHIAFLEDDLALARQYCKKFAFDRTFDGQYYRQWKKTYTRAEWYEIIEQVINDIAGEVKQQYATNKWVSINTKLIHALAPIYIAEQYLDRLLALVKNETQLDMLMRYHDDLLAQYPGELLQMYLPALEQECDVGSSRNHYAALVTKMKQIIKDIPTGKEQVLAVAQKLKLKYPRRPAMIDELKGLLGK